MPEVAVREVHAQQLHLPHADPEGRLVMASRREEKRKEKADDKEARTARDEATIKQVHKILRGEGHWVGSKAEKPKDDKK